MNLPKLQAAQIELKSSEKQRAVYIKTHIETKKQIYKVRYAFSHQINENLKNSVDGRQVFDDEEIDRIIERVKEDFAYQDFETIVYEDRPSTIVTKIVDFKGGKRIFLNQFRNYL